MESKLSIRSSFPVPCGVFVPAKLEPLGVLTTVLTLGAFGEFQVSELAKWGKAVRESGATID